MPTSPGDRWALTAPLGTDLIANGDDSLRALVAALEAKGAIFSRGPLASRPVSNLSTSPPIYGRLYEATDAGVVYWDTGTGWIALNQPRQSFTQTVTSGNWPVGAWTDVPGMSITWTPTLAGTEAMVTASVSGRSTGNVATLQARIMHVYGGALDIEDDVSYGGASVAANALASIPLAALVPGAVIPGNSPSNTIKLQVQSSTFGTVFDARWATLSLHEV